MILFKDRTEAGRQLARHLAGTYAEKPNVVILGLPRGGVPVAFEVAQELQAPLDVFVVRKLGVPQHEELAMGAVASGGVRILNDDVIRYLQIPDEAIARVAEQEQVELQRREHRYRGNADATPIHGHTVILVDDGLATGASMQAAVTAVRKQQPAEIVVAVPVAAQDACQKIQAKADECVCLETPEPFHGVGAWYEDFPQLADAEVGHYLERSTT